MGSGRCHSHVPARHAASIQIHYQCLRPAAVSHMLFPMRYSRRGSKERTVKMKSQNSLALILHDFGGEDAVKPSGKQCDAVVFFHDLAHYMNYKKSDSTIKRPFPVMSRIYCKLRESTGTTGNSDWHWPHVIMPGSTGENAPFIAPHFGHA